MKYEARNEKTASGANVQQAFFCEPIEVVRSKWDLPSEVSVRPQNHETKQKQSASPVRVGLFAHADCFCKSYFVTQ